MASQSLAKRYAKALSDLSIDRDRLDQVAEELSRFVNVFQANKDLREVLSNPVYPFMQRKSVLREVVDRLNLNETVINFLLVLFDNHRFDHLELVEKMFHGLVERHLGRIQVEVLTARPLAREATDRLEETFQTITKHKVSVKYGLDPQSLGGMVVKVGSLVFDASVANQLEMLAHSFRREL